MIQRILVLALASLALAAACAQPAPEVDVEQGQIGADLREHTVTLTSNEVRAGEVTFAVRNRGGIAHNFVVIRTDAASDALPVDQQTQQASEEGRVGGIDEIAPGRNANVRLDLEPGQYVVICNVPTHYGLGMHTKLTVR